MVRKFHPETHRIVLRRDALNKLRVRFHRSRYRGEGRVARSRPTDRRVNNRLKHSVMRIDHSGNIVSERVQDTVQGGKMNAMEGRHRMIRRFAILSQRVRRLRASERRRNFHIPEGTHRIICISRNTGYHFRT